ncbi:MAG: NAD(P)/FAD-dependent oxidoreductase [Burkholderiales bacterium]
MKESCDVLVIGGGPAGSTISAFLAEQGWQVQLLEKDTHPRFHIGESLLPMNRELFARLGVAEEIARIGVVKSGAEFHSMVHGKAQTFYFAHQLEPAYRYAYQVRRAEFDHILLRNCAAKGADVREQHRVIEIDFASRNPVVTALDSAGRRHLWETRFVVDASGRDTFLANRFDIKRKNRRHASAALFAHFKGAQRWRGEDEGNISVYWFDHGWIWFIPLKDDIMSVGAVCRPAYLKSRKNEVEPFFLQTLQSCPLAAERLRGATLASPVTATGNYSYRATRMSGERYLMIGDAYAFVDPVFSSGVWLAMNSACRGAEVVDDFLRGRKPQRRRAFERSVRRGLSAFTWFIYRVNTPALRHLLLNPNNRFRVVEGLLSLLAGDIFGRTKVAPRLFAFKLIYYAMNLKMARQSFKAYVQRKQNVASAAR